MTNHQSNNIISTSKFFNMIFQGFNLINNDSMIAKILQCLMPRKYIKIQYLYTKVPFRECNIQFVVKKREEEPIIYPEIQFYANSISCSVDENIELVYAKKHINTLAIFLFAINNQNRVSCIGYIPLNLSQVFFDRRQKLGGFNQQIGYLIYSSQDNPFPQMNKLVNVKLSASSYSDDPTTNNLVSNNQESKKNYIPTNLELSVGQIEKKNEKNLLRSKKEDQLQNQQKEIIPLNNSEATINQNSKSEGEGQIFQQSHQDQNYKTSLQYEQMKTFCNQIAKYHVKNAQYFKIINYNRQFLTKISNRMKSK